MGRKEEGKQEKEQQAAVTRQKEEEKARRKEHANRQQEEGKHDHVQIGMPSRKPSETCSADEAWKDSLTSRPLLTEGNDLGSPQSPVRQSMPGKPNFTPFRKTQMAKRTPLEELQRAIQSHLNKICPDNISTITSKIAMIRPNSAQELEVIAQLIFEKAVVEPHYCPTYAELIFNLCSAFSEFLSNDGSKSITFRSSIIDICQNEYEHVLASTMRCGRTERNAASDDGDDEFKLASTQKKGRMLANMTLIGHLFLRQMLPARIISSMLQELVLGNGEEENSTPEEHSIECACVLLMSTGCTLDSKSSGRKSIQLVCDRMWELSSHTASKGKEVYSKRVRFVIQDVLDTRLAGWTKKSFKSIAKTKDEVRQDQKQELNAKVKRGAPPMVEQVVAGQRPVGVAAGILGARCPPVTST